MEGKIKSGKDLAERIANRNRMIEQEHGQTLERYDQAGRIGWWLIKRKYPRVASHYQYRKAQASVAEAKRSAQQHEGHIVIY